MNRCFHNKPSLKVITKDFKRTVMTQQDQSRGYFMVQQKCLS